MAAPQWTNKISDSVVCNYFYIFFVIFSVLAGINLIAGIWIFTTSKMSGAMLAAIIFNILMSFGITGVAALFAYLICERALKPAMQMAASQASSTSDYNSM